MANPRWAVRKYENGAWVNEHTLPAPGVEPMEEVISSLAKDVLLYDGSEGTDVPPEKEIHELTNMVFLTKDSTLELWTRLKAYNSNNTRLEITKGNGEVIQGEIRSLRKKDKLTGSTQKYQIKMSLKILKDI
jgi:hypothetical protein